MHRSPSSRRRSDTDAEFPPEVDNRVTGAHRPQSQSSFLLSDRFSEFSPKSTRTRPVRMLLAHFNGPLRMDSAAFLPPAQRGHDDTSVAISTHMKTTSITILKSVRRFR